VSADLRTLFCPNCGAPIQRGELNCAYCGNALYVGRATEVAVPALAEAQKAIPALRERIKENPYDGDAYYQLGLACFTLKFYDQAEDAFEQAKRLLPGVALAHYFAGLAMLFNSETEILSIPEFRLRQIKDEFDTAAQFDPNLLEAKPYCDFADGLIARNREDYAAALGPLQAAANVLPDFPLPHIVLAACYFQIADYERAIQAGNQVMQLQPQNVDIAFLIGSAYARLGDVEQTQAWARRIAEARGSPAKWRAVLRELRGLFE